MLNVEPAKYGPAHHPAVIDSRQPAPQREERRFAHHL